MTVRMRSSVWARLIDRVSSRGAVPKTSAVTAARDWSPPNQSTKLVIPAWATSPTHDRSSAERARNHSWSASIWRTAAAPRSPAARATRVRVSDVGMGAVYLCAPDKTGPAGQSVPNSIAAWSRACSSSPPAAGLSVIRS